MEYNFSKISTEGLRKQVNSYEKNKTLCNGYFSCSDCPMYKKAAICNPDNGEERYKLFKEELIRREKMENKMPELKAGMIVEYVGDEHLYILMPHEDGLMSARIKSGHDNCTRIDISDMRKQIENIYYGGKEDKNYYNLFSRGTTKDLIKIWSKKSDKDIKIEELEATIKKAQEQIQELKR